MQCLECITRITDQNEACERIESRYRGRDDVAEWRMRESVKRFGGVP